MRKIMALFIVLSLTVSSPTALTSDSGLPDTPADLETATELGFAPETLPPKPSDIVTDIGEVGEENNNIPLPENNNEEVLTPVEDGEVGEATDDTTPPNAEEEPTPIPSEPAMPDPVIGPIAAKADDIFISEIYSNPDTTTGEGEWVELHNPTDTPLALDGMTFCDAIGVIYTFSAGSRIAAGEYLVVSGWKNKLNNTGDTLTLLSPQGETIAGPIAIPAASKGKSWLPDETREAYPTPGVANPELPAKHEIPAPSPEENLPTERIIINEIFPSPSSGEAEWVELTSEVTETVDVSGFRLADAIGDFYTLPAGSIIPASGFLVVSGWKNKLNNGGDSVQLKTPAGTVLETVSYPSVSSGAAWAFDGEAYRKTSAPTQSESNRFPVEEKKAKSDVPWELKKLAKTQASIPSPSADTFELIFSEVVFSGEIDFVELYCKKCDLDLGGVRVGDDDSFFEFPARSFIKSGEYIVIAFGDNPVNGISADAHFFRSKKSGLTATDETLFILDSKDTVEDALCVADQNDEFSPGELEDVVLLIKTKALYAEHPVTEAWCFDSRKLKSGISLMRDLSAKTKKSAFDYFADTIASPGKANAKPPLRSAASDLRLNFVRVFDEGNYMVEIINTEDKLVNSKGFLLTGVGDTGISLPEKIVPPKASIFVSFQSEQEPKLLELKDHWGTTSAGWQGIPAAFQEGTTDLVLSEIVSNPLGKDAGNEYVELVCETKRCEAETFVLKAGKEMLLLPQQTLSKGDFLTVTDLPLRNSDLFLTVFDLKKGIQETITVTKASQGMAFIRHAGEFVCSAHPTPESKNLLVAKDKAADSDSDGIPDHTEVFLGSDPGSFDAEGSTAHRLYRSFLRHHLQMEFDETADGFTLTGRALPNSWVRVVMHSEEHVFFASTDKMGSFTISASPDISPGWHSLDLISPSSTGLIVLPEKLSAKITKNPREGWLTEVGIFRVLPNPKGKDGGREYVIIQNTGEQAGWLKQSKLASEKKAIPIPSIYLLPGQKKVLIGKTEVPALKNKAGILRLLDADGRELDALAWANAKEGQLQYRGMPQPNKKAKKAKQKKSKYRPPIPDELPTNTDMQHIEGEWLGFEGELVKVKTAEGQELSFPLDESFSAESLEKSLSPGDEVTLFVSEKKVIEIRKQPPSLTRAHLKHPFEHTDWFLTVILVMGITAMSGLQLAQRGGWQKIKEA